MMPDEDFIVEYMRKNRIRMTRANYLNIAFLGDVPDDLDAEFEATIPARFLRKSTLLRARK